jgi:hypothetical protein
MGKIVLDLYGDEDDDKNVIKVKDSKKFNILDKIKNKIKDKYQKHKQQKEYNENLKKEALEEAQPEIKKILKEKYKQEQIDKLTKPKKNPFQILADDFKNSNIGTDDKIDRMLGKTNSSNSISQNNGDFKGPDNNKINEMLSINKNKKDNKTNKSEFDDKINKMLGKR